MYNYDGTSLTDENTNLSVYNANYNLNNKYTGVLKLTVDDENLPSNFTPSANNTEGYIYAGETNNFELSVSDQDGDELTYTIIDTPTKGSVIITDTQQGAVATYTPNPSFTSGSDTFTYKANDGSEDSNIAQVNVYLQAKPEILQWGNHFATTNGNGFDSAKDNSGNIYISGYFYDYSNFKDGTSLDAIYPKGTRDGFVAKYNGSDGELLWVNTFGSDGVASYARKVVVSDDGDVIIAASSSGDNIDYGDQNPTSEPGSIFLKYNGESGDLIWKSTVGGNW